MESRSAPALRGRVPCQGLLLAVSLLTFWSLPTTAKPTVVPTNAAEGKDTLLLVHDLPEDPAGYSWHKGGSVEGSPVIVSYRIDTQKISPGPAYSGRETILPNGSLVFQKVTLNDTGNYTLAVTKGNFQVEVGTGQLRVYPELPKPNITSNNSNPEEHKDPVVLTCESQTQDTTYLWMINGQSLPGSARLELSKDNRTLTLLNVTRKDTGPYECETRNPVSANRSDPLTLNVLYGPDTPTISPSDSHYRPGANLSLSCHAVSNPPAQYSWFINGRHQQPTRELFIPRVTANDSGSYACLAHNSVTGLNRTTVRTITVSDMTDSTPSSPGLSGGAIAGIVIGVLAGVALVAALLYFLYIRKTGGASHKRDTPEHKPSASNRSQDHCDNPPKEIPEVTYSSISFKAQEPKNPTSASPTPTITESVYSEVKK